MKKLLLLGGSAQQIVAIETAKRLGYQTVLCDYLPDNPGQTHADVFYPASTTDMQAVLEIATKERVDGVLAYASDPAAPTAAWVAERLGLPTSPYTSVDILCHKDKFRAFLAENGFHTPKARGYSEPDEALEDLENGEFAFPVIIKPVDSSGSKGVTVLRDPEPLPAALNAAFSFSRAGRVIVEEYIEKRHPYLIGGDIFVVDGEVRVWGLMNCHRDACANPLVPVGKSYPALLEAEDLEQVRRTLQTLVDKLHIRSGAMNVELVVDKAGRVFPIDIGPRAGGNMIPDLLGRIFSLDLVEMSVLAAMGETIPPFSCRAEPFWATYNLHSTKNGRFQELLLQPAFEKAHIVAKHLYKKPGDPVEFFDNASKALGILFLKFDGMEPMLRAVDHPEEWLRVALA